MKTTLLVTGAIAAFLFTSASWAQSLTPIQGWVPLDSGKAKLLMQHEPALQSHQETQKAPTTNP
jgi:hypothetical protein